MPAQPGVGNSLARLLLGVAAGLGVLGVCAAGGVFFLVSRLGESPEWSRGMAVLHSQVPVVYLGGMDRAGAAVVTPVIHLDGDDDAIKATASASRGDDWGPEAYAGAMMAAPQMDLAKLSTADLRALATTLRDIEAMRELLMLKHQWPTLRHQLRQADPSREPEPGPDTQRALAFRHDTPYQALAEALETLNRLGVAARLVAAAGVPATPVAIPLRRGDQRVVLSLAGGKALGVAYLTAVPEHMIGLEPGSRTPVRIELTDAVVRHVGTLERYSSFTRLLYAFADPPTPLPADARTAFEFWCRRPIDTAGR